MWTKIKPPSYQTDRYVNLCNEERSEKNSFKGWISIKERYSTIIFVAAMMTLTFQKKNWTEYATWWLFFVLFALGFLL